MPKPGITHLKAFYAKNKGKMSYAAAMKAARASYTKKGAKSNGAKSNGAEPKRAKKKRKT